ncbi:GNAT family N-acetyltransferase [Cohnella sp.]|uniref:GNAT family N-acetyltransferase n=1 Tax=Cohnella sp. TaxID=1883426 RepID=UPI003563AAA6
MKIQSLNIRLREAAEEVWALQHPAYRVEAALIGVADLPPLRDTIQTLQNSGEIFLGGRNEEGELVGAVSYETDGPGRFTICRVMVHPEFMRQGIGAKLLEAALAAELSSIIWSVTAEIRNLPALRLYETFGFERVETFEPVPGITMVRLVRQLAPEKL